MRKNLSTKMSLTKESEGSQVKATRPLVLLVNLGTPQAPTAKALRPFLREFLSDRRVIEMHPALWRPILEGIILRVRPRDSAKKYATIWYPEGSPLMHWSLRQGEILRKRLSEEADVAIAMRYGEPSLRSVLTRARDEGRKRVLILPLYPQYAASSAGSVSDELARWMLASRDQLEVRTVRSFPISDAYIAALASAIESSWAERGRPDFASGARLVLSFHSIPEAMHKAGDPYRSECEATAQALRICLGLGEGEMLVRYQSVFGRAAWIGPATIDTMSQLGAARCPRVDVVCPGFMADCLETLEEIACLNRETFTHAGGGEFAYIPWANDSHGCSALIEEQARQGIAGWV